MTQDLKICYEFIPQPKILKKKMRFAPLTGNEFKTMDLIIDIMASWSDTRQDFQKELSGSYLAKNINLSESAIYRAISGLIRKGFLTVVSEARKGVGRVLKILFDDLQFLHIKTVGNKKEQSIKENNNTDVDFSKNKDNSSPKVLQETQKTKSSENPFSKCENFSKNLPERPAEVLPHAFRNGIKILKKRGISNLAEIVRGIKEAMKGKVIDNIQGYWTQLCKDFSFNDKSQEESCLGVEEERVKREEMRELYERRMKEEEESVRKRYMLEEVKEVRDEENLSHCDIEGVSEKNRTEEVMDKKNRETTVDFSRLNPFKRREVTLSPVEVKYKNFQKSSPDRVAEIFLELNNWDPEFSKLSPIKQKELILKQAKLI